MNPPDPLASLSNFAFSVYGALTLVFLLGLGCLLWSDQLKRRWYDRIERKKWEQWNVPKRESAAPITPIKRNDPTGKR
jgi:hypothetical protein